MKSFCIKTNNEEIINYLLNNLEISSLENIYFLQKDFKCYKNVIVHYLGNCINDFIVVLSDIITNAILIYYEPLLLKRLLNFNYFYFDEFEKKMIEQNCFNYIALEENNVLKYRNKEIEICTINYINENKSMILDGFVDFRLENYITTLEEIIDYSTQQYIIEKEYIDFINLLKVYIESKCSEISLVHLIYSGEDFVLLDKNKHLMDLDNSSLFNAKYLSDISFSANDYILNALLTLLPKKIEIHCSPTNYENEFINTLRLIFEDRVSICNGCNLCKTYRILNNV